MRVIQLRRERDLLVSLAALGFGACLLIQSRALGHLTKAVRAMTRAQLAFTEEWVRQRIANRESSDGAG